MGSIKFAANIIMISLFTIAIITFATNFGVDNNSAVRLDNDSSFESIRSDMSLEVANQKIDANSSSKSFSTSTILPGDDTHATGGQFKIGIGTSLKMINNALVIPFNKIFGKDIGFGIFLNELTPETAAKELGAACRKELSALVGIL